MKHIIQCFPSVKNSSKEISRKKKSIYFNFGGKFLVNKLEEFRKLSIIIWLFHMDI